MVICPNCGQENPERARFCLNCATPLAETPPARERKIVTVLFADVTGSTSLGERLDPERLKDVMSAYFAAMREEIQAEGGTVEKFIGDAVMAAFGVPKAHEDDAARALRAALRMRRRLRGLNDDLASTHGVALEVRIGVNSGEVLAQPAPSPGEGMVTGDAVNVAARLEQAAEPGQVVVAERTAKAARGFTFRNLGPLQLKGKGQMITALELVGDEQGGERGVPGLRAPMVGRDRELDLLSSIYGRVASEGRPHLVTIYGDAGVGKSRLTAEFLDAAEERSPSPSVVRGRCLPYGEGVTYWPLAEILKGYAGVLDSDPPQVALEKLRAAGTDALTADRSTDPARTSAALAYTLGLEDPEFRFSELPPRQVRLETHTAWRVFFSVLGSREPTIVVIEDIHWADNALLDLLEELADRVQASVLFVCPARPELTQRRPTWGGGKRSFSSIFLDPLSPDEADQLVGFLLSVEELPPKVHGEILQRAEGNPFFLEEIIRHLIDEGRIVRSGDRWRAASSIGGVVIPDTVQGVLAARIDLLAPEEKKTLQSAAVVGRIFWTGPVGRLLNGDAEQVDDILDRLEDRELVLARLGSSMAGDREYSFKHILTRDVAYDSLPRRDRATAHATVATWIEDTAGERRREFAEVLAHHYAQAHQGILEDTGGESDAVERLRRKAFEYLLLASTDAWSKLVVQKAERLAELASSIAATDAERAEALEALGNAYQANYQGNLAYRYFKEAADIRLAGVPEDARAIARICARTVEVPLRWPGSMATLPAESEVAPYLEIGLRHAGDEDNEELARLLTGRSFWPYAFPEVASGDEAIAEAKEAGERAVAMARRLNRPDLASAALDGLGGILMNQGDDTGALRNAERRVQLIPQLQDPMELGDIYGVAAWTSFHVGHYADALRYAEEGIRRAGSHPGLLLHCRSWAVVAMTRLADWDGALATAGAAERELGDRKESPPGFTWRLLGAAAYIHELRGNRAAADRYLSIIRRMAEQRGSYHSAAPWLLLVLGFRGEFEEARAMLADYEVLHTGVHRALLLESECDVVAFEKRWRDASEVVERSRAHALAGGAVALTAFADRLEGRAATGAEDLDHALPLLERAQETFTDLGATWEAACTEQSLAEALVASGRNAEATSVLHRALAVFDELRSVRQQARARQVLAQLG